MRFKMVGLLCGVLIFMAGMGFLGTIKATGNDACGGCKAAGAAEAGSTEASAGPSTSSGSEPAEDSAPEFTEGLTAEACCGECGKVNKVFHEIQTALRLSDVQMDTLRWVLDRHGVRLEGEGMCQRCKEEGEEAEGGGMCGMCRGEKEGLESESEGEEECAEMEANDKVIELLEKIRENTDKIYQALEKKP